MGSVIQALSLGTAVGHISLDLLLLYIHGLFSQSHHSQQWGHSFISN